MHRVFVYGTLKRGFTNHGLLETSVFIGAAHTVARYCMIDGDFPVLRDAGEGRHPVSGELYDVDDATLVRLDELEDIASGMYDRVEVDIVLLSLPPQTCKAFIYVGGAGYWDYRANEFCAKLNMRNHLDWTPRTKP